MPTAKTLGLKESFKRDDIDSDIPCRRVKLRNGKASQFFSVSPKQANQFFTSFQQHDRTFLVWLAVLNSCRTQKSREVKFTRKWHADWPISRKTLLRGLKRLETAGLVELSLRGGVSGSVVVTLTEGVTYDVRS